MSPFARQAALPFPAPSPRPLQAHLVALEHRLWLVPGTRRKAYLRDLEAHLLDEAEDLGLGEQEFAAHLATRHDVAQAARTFQRGVLADGLRRVGASLLPALLAPSALLVAGASRNMVVPLESIRWGIHLSAALLVILLLRDLWERRGFPARAALSMLSGVCVMGLAHCAPLALPPLAYGAFLGWAVERASAADSPLELALDPLLLLGALWLYYGLPSHPAPLPTPAHGGKGVPMTRLFMPKLNYLAIFVQGSFLQAALFLALHARRQPRPLHPTSR